MPQLWRQPVQPLSVSKRFMALLSVEERGRSLVSEEQTAADAALLVLLLDDIAENGLELGHGAAKGFGWFEVTVVRAVGEST